MCYCTLQLQRWIVFLSCTKEVWFIAVFICLVALFLFVGGVVVKQSGESAVDEEILGCG